MRLAVGLLGLVLALASAAPSTAAPATATPGPSPSPTATFRALALDPLDATPAQRVAFIGHDAVGKACTVLFGAALAPEARCDVVDAATVEGAFTVPATATVGTSDVTVVVCVETCAAEPPAGAALTFVQARPPEVYRGELTVALPPPPPSTTTTAPRSTTSAPRSTTSAPRTITTSAPTSRTVLPPPVHQVSGGGTVRISPPAAATIGAALLLLLAGLAAALDRRRRWRLAARAVVTVRTRAGPPVAVMPRGPTGSRPSRSAVHVRLRTGRTTTAHQLGRST